MPGTLVIFGASGDLAGRKLFPALCHLFRRGLLHEETRIVGCGRTAFTDDSFRDRLRGALQGGCAAGGRFLERVFYQTLHYDVPGDYVALSRRLEALERGAEFSAGRTIYLAMPAALYPPILAELAAAGLLTEPGDGRWRHVVLEKPFGGDLESARELDRFLHRILREDQIYRIDHYLGKETVQNIMMLRFANLIFEPLWNARYVDHVQLTVAETLGVGGRAGYYDRTGQLRDMFQNHMLEMLALAAMERPADFSPDAVRDEKVRLIGAIRPFDRETLADVIVCGQYDGYCREPGVAPDSTVETYVAASLRIDNDRWRGVPFFLRTGKKLAARRSEIAIVFKPVSRSIFAPVKADEMQQDTLVLRVQPDEGMELTIQAKQPGPKLCMGGLTLDFHYADLPGGEFFEAYERLLLDAMLGDQTLFLRSDVIDASWRLLTPVLERRETLPLVRYAPGSQGPAEAERLTGTRGWRAIR